MKIRGRASVCPNASLPKPYSAIATRPAYLPHLISTPISQHSPRKAKEIGVTGVGAYRMSYTTTTTMAGTGTENSEDLQSLYNAVLQGFANEEPEPSPSPVQQRRALASPASGRSLRPLPSVPWVAQSMHDSIPLPSPPMPKQ